MSKTIAAHWPSPQRGTSRLCLLLLCLLSVAMLQAQGGGSLTDDFPGRSAKERSRIAAKEGQEAEKDQAYQRLMTRADSLFRAGALQEALADYKAARELRPYNVYPKVKIEDLEAMLEARRSGNGEPGVAPTSPPPSVVAPPTTEGPGPTDPGTRPAATVRCIERRYREGNAHVIERMVPADPKDMVYRRVSHPNGQVFHFKDGRAVDAREWDELTRRFAFEGE